MSTPIAAGKVVGFHYTLRNDAGEVVDSSDGVDPLTYMHGAGSIVPGLENALAGKTEGDAFTVVVPPTEGYGVRNEGMVHEVPRSQFPPDVEIEAGMQFGAQGPDGQAVPVWVAAVTDEAVTVDFNHPLAGQQLHFEITVASVRDATAEEVEHGHAHGPGGHDH